VNDYLVLSSTSLGFRLYSFLDHSITLHPKRGKVTFSGDYLLPGDHVLLDPDGLIQSRLTRHNELCRPRLANADLCFVLVSAKEPDFSSYLLDKFLTLTAYSQIASQIVITKVDLLSPKELTVLKRRLSFYKKIGFTIYLLNAHDPQSGDFPKLAKQLPGKAVCLMGQTGVGKSTLLNAIDPSFQRKVDALDVEIGRGRHTTKEVILLPYEQGFLFDTPGFSELDLWELSSEDLAIYFPGYGPYFPSCHFNDCHHLPGSHGCAVLDAIKKRELSKDSYYNYLKIAEEVKDNSVWKQKKSSGRPS
jgi:ribosome biogenesis GTPase